MRKNPPYQSPLLDKVLHRHLQSMEGMLYSRDDAALKSVALIGMLLPDKNDIQNGIVSPDDIYCQDQAMLRKTFDTLSKAGIPLNPEAKFHVYNILPPVQSDFLSAATHHQDVPFPKNDLAVIMYLPKHGLMPHDRFYNIGAGFKDYSSDELYGDITWSRYVSVSRMHHEYNIWADASKNTSARIVITHGGTDDEITTEQFKDHTDFKTLVDSHINQKEKGQYARNNMGVMIQPQMLECHAANLNSHNEIGAAILDSLKPQ
tara:strand:+ start:5431 stop:6213 length:783 start_codon:yes stop_codon:yes gene_type:complete